VKLRVSGTGDNVEVWLAPPRIPGPTGFRTNGHHKRQQKSPNDRHLIDGKRLPAQQPRNHDGASKTPDGVDPANVSAKSTSFAAFNVFEGREPDLDWSHFTAGFDPERIDLRLVLRQRTSSPNTMRIDLSPSTDRSGAISTTFS
jgi:hypothetical protein